MLPEDSKRQFSAKMVIFASGLVSFVATSVIFIIVIWQLYIDANRAINAAVEDKANLSVKYVMAKYANGGLTAEEIRIFEDAFHFSCSTRNTTNPHVGLTSVPYEGVITIVTCRESRQYMFYRIPFRGIVTVIMFIYDDKIQASNTDFFVQ